MIYQAKESYETDERVVLTLDAGGTNLVFSAMKGASEMLEPFVLPCMPDDTELTLRTIEHGFKEVASRVKDKIEAISFAFPGPADYERGIIGDLPNLPAFRGGVALGPFLQEVFHLPVHINNDANLYVLGEHVFGFLPEVNRALKQRGSEKKYLNLVGITLGSGFGCGIMINGQLNIGDNCNGGELWLMRNRLYPDLCTDASVGQEKIRRFYAEFAGVSLDDVPGSEGVYRIARGELEGDKEAAIKTFTTVGEIIGDALANTSVLVDGLIVIGGGLSGAHEFLMPAIMKELNGTIEHLDGVLHPRIAQKAYFLDQEREMDIFLEGDPRAIPVPFTDKKISYDASPRIGLGISKLGASRAIALGAYIFAISSDNSKPT
jgi:glucokinase